MFQSLIRDNQQRIQDIILIPRTMVFDFGVLRLQKILSFVGPRRAGKTFFLYQIIREMIARGDVELRQVVFLDFSEFSGGDFDFDQLIMDAYELCPDLSPLFVFDEIQEVNNFRAGILRLFNTGWKVFLTGSNSRLLSSELSTHFSGRNIEYQVFPLSFLEFLTFQGYTREKYPTPQEQGILRNHLHSYLQYGGYPEIAIAPTSSLKLSILQNYLDIIVYKDLKERYRITNEYVMKYLIKKVILSNTKDFSIHKVFSELKSQNIEISKNTLYNYLEYLKNIFFLSQLTNGYTPLGSSKVFLTDWGYGALYRDQDLGQRLENMVFLILRRQYPSFSFLRGAGGEIDFFIEGESRSIQVVYELSHENMSRELTPLMRKEGKRQIIFFSDLLTEADREGFHEIEFTHIFDFCDESRT